MYVEITPDEFGKSHRKVYDNDRSVRDGMFPTSWIVPDASYCVSDDDLTTRFIYDRLNAHKSIARCALKNMPLVGTNKSFTRKRLSFDISRTTKFYQFDFDYYLTIRCFDLSLEDRIDLVLKDCPWLKGVGSVWQLSSSACLDWVHKNKGVKDYSKRISVRCWGIANEALSQADWKTTFDPYNTPGDKGLFDHHHSDNKGYFDKAMFNDTPQIHFTAPPDISALEPHITLPNNDLILIDGNPLDIGEMRSYRNISVPVSMTGDMKDITFHTAPGKFDEIIYHTEPNKILQRLREFNVRGSTNEIFQRLYLNSASRNLFDVSELTNEYLEERDGVYINCNLWDAEWNLNPRDAKRNLEAKERWAIDVYTNAFYAKDGSVLREFNWQKRLIKGKTVSRADIRGINQDGTYTFALDTGMGKTSVIGNAVVSDCIDYDKTMIYVTPLKSLTMGDATELSKQLNYPIKHYLSDGSSKEQIIETLKQPIVFVCFQGLERFIRYDLMDFLDRHTLIVDEAAWALVQGNNTVEDSDNFKVFKHLCRTSKRQVFMDADINQRYHCQLISILCKQNDNNRLLFENVDSYNRGKNYVFFSDWYDAMLHTIETLLAGKRVYINVDFSNETEDVRHNLLKAFDLTIKHFCPGKTSIAYDTHTLPLDLRNNFALELEQYVDDGLDYCVFSPAVGRGVSYIPDDRAKDFDLEMTFLASSHSTANTAFQGSGRTRRTIEHGVVFSSAYKPGQRRFNEYNFKRLRNIDLQRIDPDLRYPALVADLDELLYSNPKNHLKYLLKHKGCNIFEIPKEDGIYADVTQDLKDIHKKIKKHCKTDALQHYSFEFLEHFVKYDQQSHKFNQALDPNYYEDKSKEYEDLVKRHKMITRPTLDKYISCMLMSTQEREDWLLSNYSSPDYIPQWGYLFDALREYIDPYVPGTHCLLTHCVSHSNDTIYIDITNTGTQKIRTVVNNLYKIYQRMSPALSSKSKEDPVWAIRWFARILDYKIKVEPVGDAIKQRDAIYNRLTELHPGRFAKSDKLTVRTDKTLKYLNQKRTTELLDDDEENYLLRNQAVIALYKPEIVHKNRLYNIPILQWLDKLGKTHMKNFDF